MDKINLMPKKRRTQLNLCQKLISFHLIPILERPTSENGCSQYAKGSSFDFPETWLKNNLLGAGYNPKPEKCWKNGCFVKKREHLAQQVFMKFAMGRVVQ